MRTKQWFTINHVTGEGICDHCGDPLLQGDRALAGDYGVYCTASCHGVHEGQQRERQKRWEAEQDAQAKRIADGWIAAMLGED